MAAIQLLEEKYLAEIAANRPHVAVELEPSLHRLVRLVLQCSHILKYTLKSATNLAIYHHLECDLYVHLSYRAKDHRLSLGMDRQVSALAEAQFSKGDVWESVL